ncbi:uncharacterized protein METZ01_LOCUS485761 [marine metagenome]|uniref:Uncharacterized protein n=1 Tax=marine metagenome TaxID=408172 RepID=A0A383CKJ2_9ZZZZ
MNGGDVFAPLLFLGGHELIQDMFAKSFGKYIVFFQNSNGFT